MTQQRPPSEPVDPNGNYVWNPQTWRWDPKLRKPSHRRRNAFLIIGGIVVGFVAFSFILAAIAPPASKPAARVTPANAFIPATPSALAAAPKAPAKDGSCSPQPCANDNYGWIVSVGNFHYDAPGGDYDKPEAGNVFVTLEVSFSNKLNHEQHANPSEFVLQDGAGIKHTSSFLFDSTSCGPWEPVNVTSGASFGPKCLVFQAAADHPSGLTLVWTPNSFGGGYQLKLS